MGENKEKEASLDLTSTFYSSPSGIMEGLWRPEAFPAAALELGDVAVSLTHASEGSVQGAGLIVRLSSCLPPAPSEARPQGAAGPLGTLPLPRPPWLQERQRMSDRLEDTSLRLKDEMDLYKRMMDKLRHNRLEFQKEREATQEVGRQAPGRPSPSMLPPTGLFPPQLIEDLRKELEHLQMYKLDCERPGRGRSSSCSLGEFNARAREVELEHEVKRLKQVVPGSPRPRERGVRGPLGCVSCAGPSAGAPPSPARLPASPDASISKSPFQRVPGHSCDWEPLGVGKRDQGGR